MIKRYLVPHLSFLLCLIGFAVYFGAISHIGRVPYADSAMYASMTEGFLKTGKVDLIYYSQPPLLGMFPFTLPWISVFGMSNGSLQWFNIVVFLFGATGLYIFAIRYTKPIIATIICASLLCFGPLVETTPTFMTDVLYTTDIIYFLLITQLLQESYSPAASDHIKQMSVRRRTILWAGWCFLLISAILIRSFIALVVPMLLVYTLLLRRKTERKESRFGWTAFSLSLPCLLTAGVLYKSLTIHPMPLKTALTVDEVLKGHFEQLHFKDATAYLICALLCTVPTVLFVQNLRRHNRVARQWEIVCGVVVFFTSLYAWRNGLLSAVGVSSWDNVLTPVFVIVSTVVGIQYWRLVYDVLTQKQEKEFSAARFLILGSVLSQFFVEHLMLVPFLRHFLPVFVSLIVFCLPRLVSDSRQISRFILASTFLGITATINFQAVAMLRTVNVILTDTATELHSEGIPISDIYAGDHWYVNQYLKYGTDRVKYDEHTSSLYYIGRDESRYIVAYTRRSNLPSFLQFRYPWQSDWQVAKDPLPNNVISTQFVSGFPDKAIIYIQKRPQNKPLQ